MSPDILYGVGALLLVIGLAWGTICYTQRTPSEKAVGDRKARELFRP
jgi:hypothetical protein